MRGDGLVRDLRYAIRVLRRSPGFTATALLTIAIGIGATTAVFSILYGVLLRPLPYPQADRLVRVWEEHPGGTPITRDRWISNRTFYAWTEGHPRTVTTIGGYRTSDFTLRLKDDDVRVVGAEVSPELLAALGARPELGRVFTEADSAEGAGGVLLLSDSLWQHRFNGDPGVLGRVVTVEDEPYTIVGVLPDSFAFPTSRAQAWMPYVVPRISSDPALSQRTSGLSAIAVVSRGVTAAQVEAEGTAAARSVPVTMSTQLLFGKGGPPVVHARPLLADMSAQVRPALLVVLAGVVCLLLIACANVANLFLARGLSRQREMAVRASLGANWSRLARQTFAETALLATVGGGLGVAAASMLVRALPALAPASFPRMADVRIDAPVLTAAILAVLFTAVVAGLLPSLEGVRFNLIESLHGGDGATAGGFRGVRAKRARDLLLVAESTFAVLLLVAAALLGRSFASLVSVDSGYTPDHVVTAMVRLPRGAAPERTAEFIDRTLTALRALPTVRAAGAANMVPLGGLTAMTTFKLPADAGGGKPTQTRQRAYTVTAGYAEAIGLRLRQGRFFTDRDGDSGIRAMLVNEEFARRYLSGEVVGRRFPPLYLNDKNVETEIVGVVGNVLKDGNDTRPEPEIYFAYGPATRPMIAWPNIVVRTSGDPAAIVTTLRRTIRAADNTATIESVEPLTNDLSASVAQPRFATIVLAGFALVALALASVGLYGVLSYAVSQRRRELGVRSALGATRRDLIALVVRDGVGVTIAGIAIGLAAAVALTRLMQSALFGVTPLDPVSFGIAPIVLLIVAIAACLLPARRAAAVDPAEALRSE